MKKILFLLGIVLSGSQFANAQRGEKENYRILEDNPEQKNLFINPQPFSFGLGYSFVFGYGFEIDYTYKNIATAQIGYLKNFLDLEARNNAMVTGTKNLLRPFSQIEVGGFYHFSDKIKDTYVPVTLNISEGGSYSTVTSINVPAKKKVILGLKLSVLKYNYALKSGDDGGLYVGKDASGQSVNLKNVVTNMDVTCLSVGLIRRAAVNVKIETDNYRKKRNSALNDIYLDLLIGGSVKYDNVISSVNDVPVSYDLSGTAKRMIGWRFGWQKMFVRTIGLSTRIEIGSKPGISTTSGFFLNCTVGIPIGINATFKKKTEDKK